MTDDEKVIIVVACSLAFFILAVGLSYLFFGHGAAIVAVSVMCFFRYWKKPWLPRLINHIQWVKRALSKKSQGE